MQISKYNLFTKPLSATIWAVLPWRQARISLALENSVARRRQNGIQRMETKKNEDNKLWMEIGTKGKFNEKKNNGDNVVCVWVSV